MAQGGSFEIGAITGAISAGTSLAIDGGGLGLGQSGDGDIGAIAARTAVTAVAGGTASVLAGGKFANGAITGAFAQLYNGENYAEKFWADVQVGVESAGRSIGSAVQGIYRAAVPGYALAECAAYGGCGAQGTALAAASVIPGFKYSSAAGTTVVRGIMTSVGEVTVAGTISMRGSTLIVDDLLVWAADGSRYANSLGAAEVMRASRPLLLEARDAGFNFVQLNAVRITGANPGRAVSLTYDLGRLR